MTTTPIYCDNSRRSCAEKCLRKRYWNYEHLGKGIEPIRKGKSEFPLLTGTGVHQGIEELLRGAHVDDAVQDGLAEYLNTSSGGDERMSYLITEQCALIIGIVRAWHATKY